MLMQLFFAETTLFCILCHDPIFVSVQVKSFSKNFCENLASSVSYVNCSCKERLQCKNTGGLLNLFNVNNSMWKIFLTDGADNDDTSRPEIIPSAPEDRYKVV